jgi:L-fucose isomerase-like protein
MKNIKENLTVQNFKRKKQNRTTWGEMLTKKKKRNGRKREKMMMKFRRYCWCVFKMKGIRILSKGKYLSLLDC